MSSKDAREEALASLADRQAILECLTRFCRGMDRFDRALFLSAFHEDAVIAAGDFVGDPVTLYEWARDLHEQGQSGTMHNLLNHSCEIDGNVAHTETYYLFVGRNRDETNWTAGGRYVDRLECRGGDWRIATRTNAVEWSGLVPWLPLPFSDVPDLDANGPSSRDRDDLSYRRPLVNRRARQTPSAG